MTDLASLLSGQDPETNVLPMTARLLQL